MNNQDAIYVGINVHPHGNSIYVNSKTLAGLHLTGKDFQSMKPMVETAIKRLFLDNHRMAVNVIWLKEAFSTTAECNVLERFAMIETAEAIAA